MLERDPVVRPTKGSPRPEVNVTGPLYNSLPGYCAPNNECTSERTYEQLKRMSSSGYPWQRKKQTLGKRLLVITRSRTWGNVVYDAPISKKDAGPVEICTRVQSPLCVIVNRD